jgi:Xaa-Pro aminopeptidase
MADANLMKPQWERVRKMMSAQGIDALLVTEKFNYWLLTGHRSRQFDGKQRPMILILPAEGEPAMIVYGRDEKAVRTIVPVKDVRTYVDVPFPLASIPDTFKDRGWANARIGCEIGEFQRLGISYNDFTATQRALPGATFVDASAIFNHIRNVKLPWEIERIRTACAMTLRAWDRALARLEVGMDVPRVHQILATELLNEGGDGGHLELGLEGHGFVHTYAKGDWLWSDFGTEHEGYRSDLARMAVFGPPSDEQKREFDRIWTLTNNLIQRIRPGLTCAELARMTSDDQVKMGLPPLEGSKRVGHGIGVTSDPPSISLADETVLEPGMVLTPEPRFFLKSGQRMHLEEDVVVTATGCELLSTGAERLVSIGG